MIPFEVDSSTRSDPDLPIPLSEIDDALTAQMMVAWAGESGDPPRLGWWRSGFVAEYGGLDLFQRLLPSTAGWAVFQAAREVARRKDAELRKKSHNADRIISLFSMGFDLDEKIDERLQELKRSGQSPDQALPGLAETVLVWNRERFLDWVCGHGDVETVSTPIGRRIKGEPPAMPGALARRLVGALAPLASDYPLPHYRRVG